MAQIEGTALNDSLEGSPEADQIFGDSGTDVLNGFGGDDSLDGGADSDTLNGGAGNDTLIGGTGNASDQLRGDDGNDVLSIQSGLADGGAGNDTLAAFDGLEAQGPTILGNDGDDLVQGSAGADILYGGNGNDTLDGGAGNDQLTGDQSFESGDDFVVGGAGDDALVDLGGNNTVEGGEGNDFLGLGGVTNRGSGGPGNDFFFLSGGSDTLSGDDGDDTFMVHASGRYLLTGGPGRNTYRLGSDSGTLTVTDFVAGSSGDLIDISAVLQASTGYAGGNPFGSVGYLRLLQDAADTLLQWDPDGAAGNASSWQSPMRLVALHAATLTEANFQPLAPPDGNETGLVLQGTDGNDRLEGSVVNDTLQGLAGNDALNGSGGDDSLDGGDGADWLAGGQGNDTLVGGTDSASDNLQGEDGNDVLTLQAGWARGGLGNDTLTVVDGQSTEGMVTHGEDGDDLMQGASGADTLYGGNGNDTLVGGAGKDLLFGDQFFEFGDDSVVGGAGDDTLVDWGGNNTVEGGDGDDAFTLGGISNSGGGGPGNDTFLLSGGSDTLSGDDGDDTFQLQSAGTYLLTGGAGRETYQLGASSGTVTITDFVGGASGDMLDIGAVLDASTGSSGGSPFGTAGYMRVVQDGADTLLQWDADGASGTGSAWQTRAILAGLDATSLTGSNFRPFAPPDGAETGLVLQGTDSEDRLEGSVVKDTLEGSAGYDLLDGFGGDDLLDGGAGGDTVLGGWGNDTLVGGTDDAFDDLRGGEGNDLVTIRSGFALGGPGDDTLTAVEREDDARGTTALGEDGHDLLQGASGTETLYGGNGNDTLRGGAGNDVLIGDQHFQSGDDSIEGGAGDDVLEDWNGSNAVEGGDGSDSIRLGGISNSGSGGDGDDMFELNGGSDTLGGDGGDDHFHMTGPGTYLLTGGAGIDAYHLHVYGGAVTVTDFAPGAHGDLLDIGVLLEASRGYLPFYTAGDPFGPLAYLRLVQDRADTVVQWDRDGAAGTFHEWIDAVRLVNVAASSLTNSNYLPPPDRVGTTIVGTASDDQLDGSNGNDSLAGRDGNDTLAGGDGDDVLVGDSGGDSIAGGAGADSLAGGDGADLLAGGVGNDWLQAGAGNDTLSGGAGRDVHQFAATGEGLDTITDFASGDAIRIAAVLSTAAVTAGDGSSLAGLGIQAHYADGLTTLFVDTDGVVGADLELRLPRTFDLSAFRVSNAEGGFSEVGYTRATVSGAAYHWKNHALLENVEVEIRPADGGAGLSRTTQPNGSFYLQELPVGSYGFGAMGAVGDSVGAVTSADALAALRLVVGANPNLDPDGPGPRERLKESPYQFIAADVNEDGKVTSADALAILRMAVRAPGAPVQGWSFVDEARDLWDESTGASALARTAAAWDPAIALDVQQDTMVNLVGVLRGDVNGSWTPPSGSEDLDATQPDYFTELAAQLGVPLDVWGG